MAELFALQLDHPYPDQPVEEVRFSSNPRHRKSPSSRRSSQQYSQISQNTQISQNIPQNSQDSQNSQSDQPKNPNKRKNRNNEYENEAIKEAPEEEEIDELERYKEIALMGGDFSDIPSDLLLPLLRELQIVRGTHLMNGDVNEAESTDIVITKTRLLLTNKAKSDAQTSRQQDIGDRLAQARCELQSLEAMIERQEKNMYNHLQRKMISLEAKHHEEVENLTREWESSDKARRYNRSSNQLRQLRTQAVMLLNAHRYDEMKVVEKIADQLENEESIKSHEKWENDFNVVLQKLLNQHQNAKDKVQKAHDVKIGEYEAAKSFDLNVIKKRIQNLEREMADAEDGDKVWNLYHRNDNVIKAPPKTRSVSKKKGNEKEKLNLSMKKKVRVEDFNTLALPPLDEPKSARQLPPAAVLAAKTFGQPVPKTPRASYR